MSSRKWYTISALTFRGKIQTADDAAETIAGGARCLYFLAGLQIILGLGIFLTGESWALGPLASGIIYAVLALLVVRLRSRIIASLLVVIMSIEMIAQIPYLSRGRAVTISCLVFLCAWASIRMLLATFRLQTLKLGPSAK